MFAKLHTETVRRCLSILKNTGADTEKFQTIWAPPLAPVGNNTLSLAVSDGKNHGCLTVAGNLSVHRAVKGQAKGKGAVLQKCNSNVSQLIRFDYQDRIALFGGNYCLDIARGSKKDGAKVMAWPCHGGSNQKWYLTKKGELRSGHSHKCLTAAKGKLAMYSCKSKLSTGFKPVKRQQWARSAPARIVDVKQTDNNFELLVFVTGHKARKCAKSKQGCLFMIPSGKAVTVRVQNTKTVRFKKWWSGPCKGNTSLVCGLKAKQRGATFSFSTTASKDMAAMALEHGMMLVVKTSKKCIDNTGTQKKGVRVHAWDCNANNKNQRWGLHNRGKKTDKPLKFVQIRSKRSGMCLDVSGNSKKNGAKVVQWSCKKTKSANQIWKVFKMDNKNWFNLQNVNSKKCLDLARGNKKNGAKFIACLSGYHPHQLYVVCTHFPE